MVARRMKFTMVFILARFGGGQSAPADRWFAVDKAKHFTVSAVIQSVGYGLASGRNGHGASLRMGAGGVVIVGIGKELYDLRRKGLFSRKDLAWDAAGAATAALALHAVR